MGLRVGIILFGSVVSVVFGLMQCGDQCIAVQNCPKYQLNFRTRNWPQVTIDEIRKNRCGEARSWTGQKIAKVCCRPTVESGRDLLNLNTCGISKNTDRIANGKIAEVFQYPWMALLGYSNKEFRCGGSLIAESFVLTAAHCARNDLVFVRVGETDLSKEEDCIYDFDRTDCAPLYQDIRVERYIRHKLYSVSKNKNDIALVKLSRPAQLNDNVNPICLPLPEMFGKKIPSRMVVSGWGITEQRNGISKQLRYATVPIVEEGQCQRAIRRLNDAYTVDGSQVCAGGGSNGADHCPGDSGGPLQFFGDKRYVVYGVISWGLDSCGEESAPGVYTKVSHYLDWIIDHLK